MKKFMSNFDWTKGNKSRVVARGNRFKTEYRVIICKYGRHYINETNLNERCERRAKRFYRKLRGD